MKFQCKKMHSFNFCFLFENQSLILLIKQINNITKTKINKNKSIINTKYFMMYRKKERGKGVSYFISNEYIVNSDVWVMDETYFNEKTALLIVVGLKTTVILGTCISQEYEPTKNAYISATFIEKLYRLIIGNGNNVPILVHTDQKLEYRSKNILELFEEYNIKASVAGKNENQVAESIHNQIKTLVVIIIFEKYKDNADFKAFKTTTPDKLKKLSTTQKSKSKEYRHFLFNSTFFNTIVNFNDMTKEAVSRFNAKKSQVSDTNFDRLTLNKLNNVILAPNYLLQGTKKNPMGQIIQTFNDSGYIAAAYQIQNIMNQPEIDNETKMQLIKDLVITEDSYAPETEKNVMLALFYIASQNKDQIDLMNKQSEKMNQLLTQNSNLYEQVQKLTIENEKQLQIQKIKDLVREKRAKRKHKPAPQPFTREMVQDLIYDIKGTSFLKARLRCAFTIFTITGLRYEELRLLKVKHIISLLSNSYCPITRKKRGPSNLKAYLRDSGIQFLAERKKDFDFLITRKIEVLSEQNNDNDDIENDVQDCFLFSAEKTPQIPISRAFFNNMLNKVLSNFAIKRNMQTTYTTHSFRHDFITELWKDSNDIEFVRQFMGHKRIESTVAYIQNMSDAEKTVKLLEADIAKKNKTR